MDFLWTSLLVVVFLWADHRKSAILWIYLSLVLSKIIWAQVPSSKVPDCWFYWLYLYSLGQVFWSRRPVQLYRSQRSHNKCGSSGLWMCPLTLTTALEVWPSFSKCKTRDENFFRHQFISWLLKSCLGIWRGDPGVLKGKTFGSVLRTSFWQRFVLLTIIEAHRSDFTSNLDQTGSGEGAALSS